MLLTTPVSPWLVIFSKVVPYFLLSCVNLLTVAFVAVRVLHVPVAGSVWLLAALSLEYVFVALAWACSFPPSCVRRWQPC